MHALCVTYKYIRANHNPHTRSTSSEGEEGWTTFFLVFNTVPVRWYAQGISILND